MINTKLQLMIAGCLILAGCSSSASRMADCEAQGVSRDTCYLSEQNRQSALTAAAEKQALENLTGIQHAQAAHKAPADYKPGNLKPISVKALGIEFKRTRDGIAYIDGKAAAHDEAEATADVYSVGLTTVIVYKSGRIIAMQNGQLLGRLK